MLETVLSITPTQAWADFASIYGAKDIRTRYQWFLFEFGKNASELFLKHLLQEISSIPGTKNYKKSLMLAEVRDRARSSWWAIVASAKTMDGAKYDPKTSLLVVASRFEGVSSDPITDILENLGPWTVETIPFVPSPRAGQVVLKQVSEAAVERTKEKNLKEGTKTKALMVKHGIAFTPRDAVYSKLRIIEDIEMTALNIEFGLSKRPKSHWRPSLRWLKRQGIQDLQKEMDLIRPWVDPTFMKYRQFRHFNVKLQQADMSRIKKFQDKVRV